MIDLSANRIEVFINNEDDTTTKVVCSCGEVSEKEEGVFYEYLSSLKYTKNNSSLNSNLEFGVFSQTGSAQIIETIDAVLLNAHSSGKLISSKVVIYKNNEIDSIFFIDKVDDNIGTNTIGLSLVDEFTYFKEDRTAYVDLGTYTPRELFTLVLNPYFEKFLITGDIKQNDELLDFKIIGTYLEKDSIWNNINKLCNFCLCRCYINNKGVPTLVR